MNPDAAFITVPPKAVSLADADPLVADSGGFFAPHRRAIVPTAATETTEYVSMYNQLATSQVGQLNRLAAFLGVVSADWNVAANLEALADANIVNMGYVKLQGV